MVINIALRSIWNLYSPIIAGLFKSGVNLFVARAKASKLDDWDASGFYVNGGSVLLESGELNRKYYKFQIYLL